MSWRCSKINDHWKLKGRVSQVCLAGQRCIVGYRLVPIAAEGVLRQHIYTNVIDKSSRTVHLGKVERHFIIRRDEIHFHSQYMKTHSDRGIQQGFKLWAKKNQHISHRRLQACTYSSFKNNSLTLSDSLLHFSHFALYGNSVTRCQLFYFTLMCENITRPCCCCCCCLLAKREPPFCVEYSVLWQCEAANWLSLKYDV